MFGLATRKEVADLQQQLRHIRRLADERWQVAQERHDAVIELIAQIAECGCNSKPGKAEPKPRKKAK